MAKIDAYLTMKRIAARVTENLTKARGRDSTNNDKHNLRANFTGKLDGNSWNDAVIHLHASYGYYGSSSGYRAMDKETAEYLVKALNQHMSAIADLAIKLAQDDTEKARKEAEEEARTILTEVDA